MKNSNCQGRRRRRECRRSPLRTPLWEFWGLVQVGAAEALGHLSRHHMTSTWVCVSVYVYNCIIYIYMYMLSRLIGNGNNTGYGDESFSQFFGAFQWPLPVRCNWIVFARKMHSTTKFAITVLSKSVCVQLNIYIYIYIYIYYIQYISRYMFANDDVFNSMLILGGKLTIAWRPWIRLDISQKHVL